MGRWDRDGGKADVYVDDQFVQEIDNYYWVLYFLKGNLPKVSLV
ncbi:MAG: hypothetical protein ACE5JB_05930 [bacterium]